MHVFNEGHESDPMALKLVTRRGSWINNCQRKPQSKERMEAARSVWEKRFPLIPRSQASGYNCFGLVFAARRTCITDGNVVEKVIFRDDGYRLVPEADVMVGDVVAYRKVKGSPIEHVAVVIGVDLMKAQIRALSQWGEDGEYIHLVKDVPDAYGSVIEYWSERRMA